MAKTKKVARQSLAVKKRYAVIHVWRRGGGFCAGSVPSDETFETVNWFETKSAAMKWFNRKVQGQTATDGECNRVLLKVE
jgi:hypothetical protein